MRLRIPAVVVLAAAFALPACKKKPVAAPPPVAVSPEPSKPQVERAKPVAKPVPPPKTDTRVPPPQLGVVLTEQERKQYVAETEVLLRRVRQATALLERRELSRAQQGELEQVKSLLKQASAMAEGDPVASRNLAQRAEVLSRDLLSRTQ